MTEIHNGRSSDYLALPPMSLDELKLAIAEKDAADAAKARAARLELVLNPGYTATPPAAILTEVDRSSARSYHPASNVESPIMPPKAAPVISRDMIVDGIPRHLSSDMDNAARQEFISTKESQGSVVDYTVIDPMNDYTAFNGGHQQELIRKLSLDVHEDANPPYVLDEDIRGRLPSNFANVRNTKGGDRLSYIKSLLSRKKLAAVVLGLTTVTAAGGIAYAVNPSVFKSDNTQAAVVPGVESDATVVAPEEGAPGSKLTARDIAIGDCLDGNGNGKALIQDTVAINADMKWKIKLIDGTEDIVTDQDGALPKLVIPDAKVNFANCITPEKRDAAVKVGADNVVEINYDAIEQQIGIVAGATAPTSDAWEFDPTAGLTDQASVADVVSSMKNPAENVSVAVPIAQAQVGGAFSEDTETVQKARDAMQAKLEADINARVAGLFAAQKSPVEKVTVKFSGTPKDFVYKGPAAPDTSSFSITDPKATFSINSAAKE